MLLGIGIGAFGTLVGAGGGFILVPVLLLLFPERPASELTAVSLAVVLANAAAGSLSYLRMRRADYRSGIVLALATVPGAVAGALAVNLLPRRGFDVLMGVMLIAVAVYLIVRPAANQSLLAGQPMTVERTVVDAAGEVYSYRFNLGLAIVFSVGVGFLSSLLGVGGGILHVPLLTSLFSFPAHVATATSHFVLVFTAGAGVLTHLVHGDYGAGSLRLTVPLAAGVVVGAPLGAVASRRIGGPGIVRLLAAALLVVGLRLLIQGGVTGWRG